MDLTKINQNQMRKQIIDLISAGVSIPKISKELNVAKSTVYHHYKKIKGRKYELAQIPNNDEAIGEFLGIFSGDGNLFHDKKLGHYTISIFLHATDDKTYASYIEALINKNFNKKIRIYTQEKSELRLTFYSKIIYRLVNEYLNTKGNKTLNISLKKPIDKLSNRFLLCFVRGLVDTDGHVDKYGKIILALISKKLIEQTAYILKKFGIDSKISSRKLRPNEHRLYELRILQKEARKYNSLIGFSNKYKKNKYYAPTEIRMPDFS